MKPSIVLLLPLVLSRLFAASAEPVPPATRSAPPLRHCTEVDKQALGAWDDAFVCGDQDMIVLRRGEILYRLVLTEGAAPEEMTRASALTHARIMAGASSAGKLWLLLDSSESAPFGIEAHSGQMAEFSIPGLTMPGSHAPGIQSHVVVRHANAVVLMVAGGDRQTWPRDGNRPIYFWMSLQSGRVVRFPIGWDLGYFSRDQRIAVFQGPLGQPFQERSLQAVSMETGEHVERLPSRADGYVAFNWTETREAKPLSARRAETGDRDHVVGISSGGRVVTFDPGSEVPSYLTDAKEADGHLGLRMRGDGAARVEPGALLIVDLDSATPEHVAPAVMDFAMLKRGDCVFTTPGHGPNAASCEAFFRTGGDASAWNVLDGVERLPALEGEFATRDHIEDRLTIRLIEGFGTPGPLVLGLFEHLRGDMRSQALPPEEKTVEREVWRRAVLVTADGQRCLTDLFREGSVPEIVWLHNSGVLITGFTDHGRMHLSASTLRVTPGS